MASTSLPIAEMTQTPDNKTNYLSSVISRLLKTLLFVRSPLFHFFTFTYSGAYDHHTRSPIRKIAIDQDYKQNRLDTITSLSHFRQLKTEELRFVQGAATLSGAAAIGVFSWPTTEKAIWATKMFWNWGLFFSIFALISSAHQRLLRYLPKKDSQEFDNQQIEVALSLFLQPVVGQRKGIRKISCKMLWFWQCPTMLMSYSWVFFVTGYALHLLTPVFGSSGAKTSEEISGLTLCGCGLVVLNFIFCGSLCQHRLTMARRRYATTASSESQV